jgi:tRNA threonylcarbamoyladenosine biosynthesis protein TsaB
MLLAINTATQQYSLALLDRQGTLRAEFMVRPRKKSFSHFMADFDHLLTTLDIDPQVFEAVITVKGPGSYTGLRVGMATAKAFCQGLHIPIIGVSSLDTLANQFPHISLPICAILESRKGEVFAASYQWRSPEGLVSLTQEKTLRLSKLNGLVEGPTFFVGNDFPSQAAEIKRKFGQNAILAPPFLWCLKASSAGMLGLKRHEKGHWDNLRDLTPAYLRPPDIRPNPFPLISPDTENAPDIQKE